MHFKKISFICTLLSSYKVDWWIQNILRYCKTILNKKIQRKYRSKTQRITLINIIQNILGLGEKQFYILSMCWPFSLIFWVASLDKNCLKILWILKIKWVKSKSDILLLSFPKSKISSFFYLENLLFEITCFNSYIIENLCISKMYENKGL